MNTQFFSAEKTSCHATGPRNMYFTLRATGLIGKFRIHFTDDTKKNDVYKTLRALTVYFEGMDNDTTDVKYVTDACIFVERHSQWLLERLDREGKFDIKN